MSDERDIIEFLSQPAEDDLHDEIEAWTHFTVCPMCGAEYPDFHSPPGTLGTLCDDCGWSSEEDAGRHPDEFQPKLIDDDQWNYPTQPIIDLPSL